MNAATGHWLVVPIVLPLFAGALLILLGRRLPRVQATLSALSAITLLAVAVGLFRIAADGETMVYLVGNWRAPFGIALALDRLNALMLLLTAIVALAALVYALARWHAHGLHFHALFQFQLMGLNGAFLTADLFNLFVFFELLLIASYGLLLHGAGARRLASAIHYVVINLSGSALFLFAVGLVYAASGTLNLADLAAKLPALDGADRTLAQVGILVLLVAFCIKAALLPLNCWLPATYSAAGAPIAALFVIMTKLGVYAVLRVHLLLFQTSEDVTWQAPAGALAALGMATIVAAACGVLATRCLSRMIGGFVLVSSGTLLACVALGHTMTAPALFYLVQATLAASAFFLLSEPLARARGAAATALDRAGPIPQGIWLALAFLVLALSITGAPPLAGFLAKFAILRKAIEAPLGFALLGALMLSGLLGVVALSRAGSAIFWKGETGGAPSPSRPHPFESGAIGGLVLLSLLQTVFPAPLMRYVEATAAALHAPQAYVDAISGSDPVPKR